MTSEHPSRDTWPPFAKRFVRDHLIASMLYVVVLIGSVWTLRSFDLPLWASGLIGLAPVAPAFLMLAAYLRALAHMDEVQRRIQHESILIAAAVVGFGSFAYALAEGADAAPTLPLPLVWVLPAMIAAWGAAAFFVARRYK